MLQVMRLAVGVTDVLPKSIVQRFLEPALRMAGPLRLICREDRALTDFLDELSTHALDLVLADTPAGVGSPLKLFNHLLGDGGTTICGSARVAASLKRGFPRSLGGDSSDYSAQRAGRWRGRARSTERSQECS